MDHDVVTMMIDDDDDVNDVNDVNDDDDEDSRLGCWWKQPIGEKGGSDPDIQTHISHSFFIRGGGGGGETQNS